MKLIVLFLVTLVFSFDNPFRLVYTNDGDLASKQEELFNSYGKSKISNRDLRDLKINWWIRGAYKVAPGNLIVRQYCLIDIYTSKPSHRKELRHLVDIISRDSVSSNRLWAESYSYWLYAKVGLDLWLAKFQDDSLSKMVEQIRSGFATTAYFCEGKYRPAPFGDLWEIPLNDSDQIIASTKCVPSKSISFSFVKRDFVGVSSVGVIVYRISAHPLGLNGHCDKFAHINEIFSCKPNGFMFYKGYHDKFPTEKAEWTDLLSPIRLLTVPFVW